MLSSVQVVCLVKRKEKQTQSLLQSARILHFSDRGGTFFWKLLNNYMHASAMYVNLFQGVCYTRTNPPWPPLTTRTQSASRTVWFLSVYFLVCVS